MKVQDLMVGDLLRVNKDVCLKKGTIVEVRGIDADNRLPEKGLVGAVSCVAVGDPDRMSGGVWCEYLDPIPITPKILERNGFIYLDGSWWYLDLRIVLESSKGVSLVCGRQVKFSYIHELQHLFKNCSINHTIKL